MPPRAVSNYKQVKVVLTEELDVRNPGRVVIGVRVHVKPQHAQWMERHLVLSARTPNMAPLETMDAVYAALLEFLAAPPLPGHIG